MASAVTQEKSTHYFIILLLMLVAAVGVAASGYFYLQYRNTQHVLSATSENASVLDLINSVGKLMVLPQETPTIATVSDVTKLKGQAFFKQAQNGDKVLIYTGAKEAILYRPSLNKIISVSTVNIGSSQVTSTPSISPSQAPVAMHVKVQLFNGTSTVGLTQTAQKKLISTFKDVQVVDKSNASRSDYQKTLVVDLTGQNSQAAGQIASVLGGTVGPLPSGEQATTSADLLVILGRDFTSAK